MFLLKLLSIVCVVVATGYDYEDLEYDTNYEDYLSDDEQSPRVTRYTSMSTSRTLSDQDMREVREAVKRLLSNIDQRALTEHPLTRRTKRSDVDATFDADDDVDIAQPLTRVYDVITNHPTRSQIGKFLYHNIRREQDSNDTTTQASSTVTTDTTITTTVTTTPATTTTTKYVLPTARWPLDVPALLDLISQLATDYETNLTKKLNESFIKMSIPTCETFTPYKMTTSEYDANATGTVIAKCFVCGLEEEGVPYSAPCADAFAGDFLPLVPVDPTARAQISKFRKYCKYLNIRGYQYNKSEPRAIFGRWTGGCGVRWIDLSGIYTQRTCRSRFRATMGRHFASKRMAKLEMSLLSVDNGCIISPMATLVPLSRGISLFARFHACVCTGSWCNSAIRNEPWTALICMLSLFIRLQRTEFIIS